VLNSVLIDSGPLIALFDSSEDRHKEVHAFLKNKSRRFISTLAVLTEVSHMLDFDIRAQLAFYEWALHRGVIIGDINQNDLPGIMELTEKYADLPMDFADATLVMTAIKTGIREIISFDRDFDVYRLSGKERIRNIYAGGQTAKKPR
jgi:predicted nucleic acid-binding protein